MIKWRNNARDRASELTGFKSDYRVDVSEPHLHYDDLPLIVLSLF